MKLAYITNYDSTDLHAWSGLGNRILKSLEGAGFEVIVVGNIKEGYIERIFTSSKKIFYKIFKSKIYIRNRDPIIIKSYARQISKKIMNIDIDVIFSPGTLPIAFLKTNKPIIFWADATFAGMLDFYPETSNLCPETIKYGNFIEQSALTNSSLALYCSDWAAKSAIVNYSVDLSKVKVVPFGANIDSRREISDILAIADNKDRYICKLLFMGVDWHRKGGDIALAVAELLIKNGINVELNIVGCSPPYPMPSFVKCHGFISKTSQEGLDFIDTMFCSCHFLLLPSRAECYGLVFAEASSYGLPSIGTSVGGIPSVLHDGINGKAFPPDADLIVYYEYIAELFNSRDKYSELSVSSFNLYLSTLNWQVAGNAVYKLIADL